MTSEEENNIEDDAPASNEIILAQRIGDEMKTAYINYAMSVIIGRALPDARDGLKPVHRRVLYGMFEGGHTSDKKFSKSARSVGEVMGKYHPHGDQSIYDTMVRMAQDFSLRYPLIDGQGNFGSIDGDPPAAMRYTESRLDKISKHMLDDIKKNTVDFQPNFDDTEQEPSVLPSRLPNLLLNGSDGIAVGMATKIPPHNLNEVSSAINFHVQTILEGNVGDDGTPLIEIAEYMEHIKGPDFPTGAKIFGIDGIEDMYRTGNGKFHVRADCEVVDDDRGSSIVINAIPYQVKKSALLEQIAGLVSKETVIGIRDIRDESSKEGIRVVIEVKNNADPYAVLNQLYSSSRLQESYSANMMGIIDGKPVQMTLPVILQTYVKHREEVILRRAEFDLEKAETRAHILEGLVKAQDRIDDVVAAGKASESREHFESVLQGKQTISGIAAFDFSVAQSKAIAERRLFQLSKLNVKEVTDELDKLKIEIADLKDIIGSRTRRLNILLEELNEVVAKHGDERRTSIDPNPLNMDREDLVEERPIVITLSENNYIRHMPVDTFRVQNRGGKGMKGVTTKEEDNPLLIITCFSKDRLFIFTDQGRVYGLKAWETPMASRTSKGTHIKNLLEGMREDEKIVSILPISKSRIEEPEGYSLVFATEKGLVKRTRLSEYVRINRNGKYAIKFKIENDSLVGVRLSDEQSDVVLITSVGRANRFSADRIRSTGRVSSGIWGVRCGERYEKEGGSVVGLIVTSEFDNQILTITQNGMAKRSKLGSGSKIMIEDENGNPVLDDAGEQKSETDGYRRTSPGGVGVKTMKIDDGDSIVSVRQIPNEQDNIFLLTEKGMMIRVEAESSKLTSGRVTRGTRLMELRSRDKSSIEDRIIFAARLPAELLAVDDEEQEDASSESEEEE